MSPLPPKKKRRLQCVEKECSSGEKSSCSCVQLRRPSGSCRFVEKEGWGSLGARPQTYFAAVTKISEEKRLWCQKLGGPPIFFCIDIEGHSSFFFRSRAYYPIPLGGDDVCEKEDIYMVLLQLARCPAMSTMHCRPLPVGCLFLRRCDCWDLVAGMLLRSDDLLVWLDGLLHGVAILLRAYFLHTPQKENQSSLSGKIGPIAEGDEATSRVAGLLQTKSMWTHLNAHFFALQNGLALEV